MPPQFLVVGHVTRDLQTLGYRLGGTAVYASLAAQRLGLRAGLVTASHPDLQLSKQLAGVEVVNKASRRTTTMRNEYLPQGRVQYMEEVASPITVEDIPPDWRGCSVVLLGPVAQEVDTAIASVFKGALLGLCLQGWLRRWDSSKRVSGISLKDEAFLSHGRVAFVSQDDLPSRHLPEGWLKLVQVFILTRGREGAMLHVERRWYRVPSWPAREVDPTGAGDVFAAAYLVRYHETGDPFAAALFASAAASLKVEGVGPAAVPTREAVEARLSSNQYAKVDVQ